MTDKEQIIIDGKKEKVNILFECNHIDDLQAYEMVKNRIEITPENAPICNFKIKIVSNTKSPYGFYTIFQKDPKKDEWGYMGIGSSGASSLITALLKAHKMGLKRISDLENTKTGEVTYRSNKLLRKEQTLNAILELVEENKNTCQYQGICKSILDIINEAKGRRIMNNEKITICGVDVSECEFFDGSHLCKCDKTLIDEHKKLKNIPSVKYVNCRDNYNCYYKQKVRKERECEELKAQLNDMACMDDDNVLCYPRQELKKECEKYELAFEEIKEYTRKQFCDNCEDIGSTEYSCHCEYCEYQEYFDIIYKAKDGKNEKIHL